MEDDSATIWVDIKALKLWDRNPNEGDIGKIMSSIREHGFNDTCHLWRGIVKGGNHSVMALTSLRVDGWHPDDCKIKSTCLWIDGDAWNIALLDISEMEELQSDAFGLAINHTQRVGIDDPAKVAKILQELANSDEIDISASSYDGDDFDLILADLAADIIPVEDPGAQIDKAAELNKKWQAKRGDVWEIPSASGDGVHRIMCGDSTCAEDVGLLMGGVNAEILFTSPPYSDQREYGGNDLRIETLIEFIPTWKNYVRFQCVNLGMKFSDYEVVEYWGDYIAAARDCGLKLLAWNVWDKQQATSIGQQSQMFATYHEWVFVFGEIPKKLNRTVEKSPESAKRERYYGTDEEGRKVIRRRQPDGSMKTSTLGESFDKKQLPSVISQRPELGTLRQLHPAIMGNGLAVDYIEAMSSENEVIADPFLGSGTTIVACEQTGRVGYGMEISPDYVAVCLERLSGMGLEPQRLNNDSMG